ncbi:SDR family oxidoreductase [Streptomyces sp. NBC_01518]|uniref:type I polyketide synthase n=1 Tax=Streptomyces sp. NBC_01518 TaxID=2903891 RepID=UPI0038705213
MTSTDAERSETPDESFDIAIVGMSGRFPQARTVQEYWSNLTAGVCSRVEFTERDLLARGVEAATLADPNFVRAGYVLEDSDAFDATFFGYSPREAEIMDPQHRALLECAWEALETAGHDPQRYDGLIGVYAGAGFNSYLLGDVAEHLSAAEIMNDKQVGIGNRHDFLSTKVSYKLGLQGPSINVQSACSTSLVAIVQACQGLLDYQCDMALAGGVAVNQTRRNGYLYSQDGLYSPDGFCRTFDERAEGTVAGEGVGVVVLKRLADAIDDRDHIHAVIKGGAVNNDGSQRAGFTAPGAATQADVIATALANADVQAHTVRYIEVHGVATPLGDPIEVAALSSVYTDVPHRHCVLGSAKPNIGHLDTAAGVAGLIKAALVVEHGLIPPTLHFQHANPRIDLDNGPFYVTTELSPWPADDMPRRAAVSSFGLGGTNAHVILEEPPRVQAGPRTDSGPTEQVLVVSAKSASSLDAATDRLHDHLRAHPELALEDVAFTLQEGRQAFPYRRAVVCDSVEDALGALDERDDGRVLTARAPDAANRPVGFMFTGIGAQFPGMARELYEREPAFSDAFDRCAALLTPLLGQDIRPVVFTSDPGSANTPGTTAQTFDLRRMLLRPEPGDHPLNRPSVGHSAVFALEYSLVELWASWGVRPEALIGHSLGEYVAACVAGVFSLPDALRLIVERAHLIEAQGEGAMLAVPLTEEAAARYTDAEVCVAAVNGPETCVLAGTPGAVERVERRLGEEGIACRRLTTSHASHSPMMDPVVVPYRKALRGVELSPPKIPFVSNLTGTWITGAEAVDPDYWSRHVRDTVRFADGIGTMWTVPDIALVEIGPGPTLTPGALQHPAAPAVDRVVLSSLPGAFDAQSDRAALLAAAGRLWLAGCPDPFPVPETARRIALPTYPLERVTYRLSANGRPRSSDAPRRRGTPSDWLYAPSWQRRTTSARTVRSETFTASRWLVFLDEHGVGRQLVSRLTDHGAVVRTVSIGQTWSANDGAYHLDPANTEHYARLREALLTEGALPDRVVHCWSVGADADRAATPGELRTLLDRAFGSLARWAQVCDDELMTVAQRWDVLSTEVCAVTGNEPLCPPKAAVQGICKVLLQEYPLLDCAHLDVPVTGPADIPALVDRLEGDLTTPSDERTLALRGRYYWAPAYLPSIQTPSDTPRVKRDGVYLITGGLGRIGLHVARALAERERVRLVLLGRTALPSRESWDDPGQPEDVAERIAAVRALEALGADVMVVAADVSDRGRMRDVKAAVLQEYGPIDGVVHCAGITGAAAHRTVADLDADAIAQHFESKVYGVHAIDEVLGDQTLDFALLCSSIASILGGTGFGAYAAANAVLDAFAQSGGRSGLPWTSVNWDVWSDANTPGDDGASRNPALTAEEGRGLVASLVSAVHEPQIVVSRENIDHRREEWLNPGQRSASTARRYERPNLRNPYLAPNSGSEQEVAEIWQDLLGVEDVGVHDNFFELGGSSLLGLQVVHRLRRKLSAAVPLTIVYEGPTVRTLAALVDGLKVAR